jgi:hypothetical protein
VGFLLTTLSIFIATMAFPYLESKVAWLLPPGPMIGLISMRRLVKPTAPQD